MRLHENQGSITANCPGCNGGISTFEWKTDNKEFGAIEDKIEDHNWSDCMVSYRLFKCAGCGRGALGIIKFGGDYKYPAKYSKLTNFYPNPLDTLPLPKKIPQGILAEFREAEKCLSYKCFRAASGLFRSVLDKTLKDNGYKTNNENLYNQIENAAKDGVITQSRKNRAHTEIRVLGNDVLHDDWKEITKEDAEAARYYCQRLLEDFYDDREAVLDLLYKVKRLIRDKGAVGGDKNG